MYSSKWWTFISLFGLLAFAAPWLASRYLDSQSLYKDYCLAAGYAHGTSWLAGATVYADGHVLVQLLRPNVSLHDGFYYNRSAHGLTRDFTLRSLWIQPARGSAFVFHLALPLMLFGALCTYHIAIPLARRAYRHRKGRCLNCGYDLRAASGFRCSECGYVNKHPDPARALDD